MIITNMLYSSASRPRSSTCLANWVCRDESLDWSIRKLWKKKLVYIYYYIFWSEDLFWGSATIIMIPCRDFSWMRPDCSTSWLSKDVPNISPLALCLSMSSRDARQTCIQFSTSLHCILYMTGNAPFEASKLQKHNHNYYNYITTSSWLLQ